MTDLGAPGRSRIPWAPRCGRLLVVAVVASCGHNAPSARHGTQCARDADASSDGPRSAIQIGLQWHRPVAVGGTAGVAFALDGPTPQDPSVDPEAWVPDNQSIELFERDLGAFLDQMGVEWARDRDRLRNYRRQYIGSSRDHRRELIVRLMCPEFASLDWTTVIIEMRYVGIPDCILEVQFDTTSRVFYGVGVAAAPEASGPGVQR